MRLGWRLLVLSALLLGSLGCQEEKVSEKDSMTEMLKEAQKADLAEPKTSGKKSMLDKDKGSGIAPIEGTTKSTEPR